MVRQAVYTWHACRATSSRRLLPGNVVVVLPGKGTCDMVLLCGKAEESVLSGEVSNSHGPLPSLRAADDYGLANL